MYSDTWFPERLISDKWDSSLFSILLNWGENIQKQDVSDFTKKHKGYSYPKCKPGGWGNLQNDIRKTFTFGFICTCTWQMSQIWENKLSPSNCLHSIKSVKLIMNHASSLWEHTVQYNSSACLYFGSHVLTECAAVIHCGFSDTYFTYSYSGSHEKIVCRSLQYRQNVTKRKHPPKAENMSDFISNFFLFLLIKVTFHGLTVTCHTHDGKGQYHSDKTPRSVSYWLIFHT